MQNLSEHPAEAAVKWSVLFLSAAGEAHENLSGELRKHLAFSHQECEAVLSNLPLIFLSGLSKAGAEEIKKELDFLGVEIVLSNTEEDKERYSQIVWPESLFDSRAEQMNISIAPASSSAKALKSALFSLSARFDETIEAAQQAEEFKGHVRVLMQILGDLAEKEERQKEINQYLLARLRMAGGSFGKGHVAYQEPQKKEEQATRQWLMTQSSSLNANQNVSEAKKDELTKNEKKGGSLLEQALRKTDRIQKKNLLDERVDRLETMLQKEKIQAAEMRQKYEEAQKILDQLQRSSAVLNSRTSQ